MQSPLWHAAPAVRDFRTRICQEIRKGPTPLNGNQLFCQVFSLSWATFRPSDQAMYISRSDDYLVRAGVNPGTCMQNPKRESDYSVTTDLVWSLAHFHQQLRCLSSWNITNILQLHSPHLWRVFAVWRHLAETSETWTSCNDRLCPCAAVRGPINFRALRTHPVFQKCQP